VPGRWSIDQVLALAPDAAAAAAARKLARPGPWSQTGAFGDLLWGSCAGSGANPYRTIVDRSGPATTCTCPSRKLPCKHALGLLLLWAGGAVPGADEPADDALAWKQGRDARAAGAAARRPRGERDEAAAAKRAEQRAARVESGLAELEMWLRDQVRSGLSAAAGTYGHADAVAARMVDAQAPGVAGMLRRLSTVPASGDGWPERLLAGYGRLHLLTRAHPQLDALPAALAATVRSHVGYTVSRDTVLTEPAVTDDWVVLATRDLLDGAVAARRIWLRGQESGRFALLLMFDPSGSFSDIPDATLAPGTAVRADLHYYPGRPPLRALLGERHGEPRDAAPPPVRLGLREQLAEWAAVLELDPWLAEWPAVLAGVPVPGWTFVDPDVGAVPMLTGGIDPWVLVAVAGGRPVRLAGEWSAEGFRPLTVWHGDRAVRP
jgi:hypothetical protein